MPLDVRHRKRIRDRLEPLIRVHVGNSKRYRSLRWLGYRVSGIEDEALVLATQYSPEDQIPGCGEMAYLGAAHRLGIAPGAFLGQGNQ